MNLEQEFLGNPLSRWAIFLGIAVGCFLLLLIIRKAIVVRLGRLSKSTQTTIDDLINEVLSGTRPFILLVVSANIASSILDRSEAVIETTGQITMLAVLLQVGIWVSRGLTFLLTSSVRKGDEVHAAGATMLTPLTFLMRLVVWAVVILLGLDNLGVNITALITGLGIGGVAIALSLQAVLGDLFASLSIALDKPFVIGDTIMVNEFVGTVEHVGLKTTRVRSLSGEQVVFSNSDLLQSRIRNFKSITERRALLTIGVTYETTHEKLEAIPSMIREIVNRQTGTRFDRSNFKEYGESALNFETVYYVLSPEYNVFMDVQEVVNLEIYRKFGEEGIEFAYPTRRVLITETDSSRSKKEDIPKAAG